MPPPNPQRESYERVRAMLAQGDEVLYDTGNSLTGRREIRRGWQNINEGQDTTDALDLLGQYADIKNFPKNRQQWVDDPVIAGQVIPGRWRVADCRQNEDNRGRFPTQLLRQGFATGINWDEARLAEADYLQESEKYAVAILPNIDPRKAADIVDTLNTAAFQTNRAIQGHTFAGDWEIIRARPSEIDDGSAIVQVYLAQPRFSMTGYENYGTPEAGTVIKLWSVPKRLAQALIDDVAYKITGASAIPSYNTAQGVVDITITQATFTKVEILDFKVQDNCLIRVYHDYIFGMTEAEVEAYDVGTAPSGWFYDVPVVSYAGAGRYNLRREREEAVTKTLTAYTESKDVNATTTAVHYQNAEAVPSLLTRIVGRLQWVTASFNRFCRWDAIKRTRTSEEEFETYTTKMENGETITVYMAFNARSLNSIPAASATQFQQWYSRPSRNADETWDWALALVPIDAGLGTATKTYYHGKDDWDSFIDPATNTKITAFKRYQWAIQVKQFATMGEAIDWTNTSNAWITTRAWDKIGHRQYLGFKNFLTISNWAQSA